jgi:hypothetical protein
MARQVFEPSTFRIRDVLLDFHSQETAKYIQEFREAGNRE